MGLPVSLILIAVGAILAFAVNQSPDASVKVYAVGWILMGVGLVGLLLAMLWWERWGPGAWGWHREAYDAPVAGDSYRRGYGRRRTVVEEDAVGPPPGPDPYDTPPPP